MIDLSKWVRIEVSLASKTEKPEQIPMNLLR
jgi:hypothetical protein